MMSLVPSRRSFLAGFGSLLAAPALVRADSLMPVRSIARLLLPQFNYDSFDALKPAGVEYQWVTKLVMGEDVGGLCFMQPKGWNVVPSSRFNTLFSIAGTQIEYGDCVLVERPKSACDDARQREIAAARNLALDWSEQNRRWGFEGGFREAKTTVEFTTLRATRGIV